jgi:RNA polymerase sigma factor (sigma-70 family)
MVAAKLKRVPQASGQFLRGPGHTELIERFISEKDPSALAALVDHFGGMVWGICRRLLPTDQDAEDAFQAVFLVLLKKGATIRNREAVGSWLYGVAYRTAMKARRDLGHRKKHESKATPPASAPSPTGVASCRELQRVLDEEVDRLPSKLKAPFVLCCIEGLSKSEAAQELRWKDGTVSGRLARARKLLQQRLTRRGITLSAALTVLALTKETAAAAVPPLLVQSTIAGLTASAGTGTAAGLSPTAVSLADGVVRALAVAKLKVMTTAVLTLSLALGGAAAATSQFGQVLHPGPASPPPAKEKPSQSMVQAPRVRVAGGRPARPPAPVVELKEFYQDLRGSKPPQPPLELFGSKASQVTREEERGLHVKVVANAEQTQRIGLNLPARFRGDFEITAAYEIVTAEIGDKGHGVGVTVIVDLDAPDKDVLELLRVSRINEGQVYGVTRVTLQEDGKDKYHHEWYPTQSKAGHLRLTRRGSELVYSAREGGSDTFQELSRLKCGTYDIRGILFVAYLGYAQNSVDVYLKDLRVGPPDAGHVAAADPGEPKVETAAAPTRNRFFLILFGLLFFLITAIAVLVLYVSRRKRREEDEQPADVVPDTPPPATVFPCNQCGTRLRIPNTSAGKSVKCPRCGCKLDIPKPGGTDIKAERRL